MKTIIIANWKCNPITRAESWQLFDAVNKGVQKVKKGAEVVICPPFVYLESRIKNLESRIKLGAQDLFWEQSGAYTGEISGAMLKDSGCKYVIIGHSERRMYFKETDEMINKKLKAALSAGLIPILCVGEKKGENAERVISNQLERDLKGIENWKLKIGNLIIAYEPVWAIGTGDFCSKNKAKEALEFIKRKFNNKILYGGSVNSKITRDYTEAGFDGLLVGGASLDAQEFIKIVKNA